MTAFLFLLSVSVHHKVQLSHVVISELFSALITNYSFNKNPSSLVTIQISFIQATDKSTLLELNQPLCRGSGKFQGLHWALRMIPQAFFFTVSWRWTHTKWPKEKQFCTAKALESIIFVPVWWCQSSGTNCLVSIFSVEFPWVNLMNTFNDTHCNKGLKPHLMSWQV